MANFKTLMESVQALLEAAKAGKKTVKAPVKLATSGKASPFKGAKGGNLERRHSTSFKRNQDALGKEAAGRNTAKRMSIHKVKPQKGEFYAGDQSDDPKGDVTYGQSKSGSPYMSRCVCHGGKYNRFKAVLVSCKDKKAYNKKYKKMNPKSGTQSVVKSRRKKKKNA